MKQETLSDEFGKFRKFRNKVFNAYLKKVSGKKLSSGEYKLIRIWRKLGKTK